MQRMKKSPWSVASQAQDSSPIEGVHWEEEAREEKRMVRFVPRMKRAPAGEERGRKGRKGESGRRGRDR